jgi:hypothetical protein
MIADLLVVDGNPIKDVRILQDKANLHAILKDGKFEKNLLGETHAAQPAKREPALAK